MISQPEVLPSVEPQEQDSSTNPASNGLLAVPAYHSSCLGATPAVIRSMILSVRPLEPSPNLCVIQEDSLTPPLSIFEGQL